MGRFKKRLALLTEAEEQAKKKQETLKKMMLFSSNGKGTLNQPSQDELVKAVVQEVLRELGRK